MVRHKLDCCFCSFHTLVTLELWTLALTRLHVPGLVTMGNNFVTFWACCRFVGPLVIYQLSRAIFRNTTFFTTKSPIAVFSLLMPLKTCHWGYWISISSSASIPFKICKKINLHCNILIKYNMLLKTIRIANKLISCLLLSGRGTMLRWILIQQAKNGSQSRSGCHGLSWTTIDYIGLSWTVTDCHGLS